MAKTVVQNSQDPCISIVLVEVDPGVPGKAQGTHGICTECGWPLHRWNFLQAIADARVHVDMHDPVTIGGDPDSLVR